MAKPSIGEKSGRDTATGRFLPGNTGGGRKAIPKDIKEMLAAATPSACKLLADTVADDEAKLDLRIRCAEIILDRVHGKPKQSMELDGQVETAPQVVLSMSEKTALLREVAEKFGKADG